MLFALLHNQKVLGLFDNYDSCTNMLSGLVSNNFVENDKMNIVAFENNSIKLVKPVNYNIDSDTEYESESETPVTTEEEPIFESKESKQKKLKEEEKKHKHEYNLNVLKKKKERINEQRRIFAVDIDLYQKFKDIKEKNVNFVIPEMFEKKYIIMEELEKQKCLNCDTFYQVYENDNMDNSWSNLFDGKAKDPELLEISSDSEEN